jgi:phosphoribosylformylglycinamidine cyclo-ligase
MKYADAGVNIAVADEVKQRIRHHANRTFTSGVLGSIGGFGALFAMDHKNYKEPVLVSSADGVGTKLKVAIAMGVHSTVGGDLVNHCINDILVQGASPLFFLDYLAMGKLEPNIVEQLIEGMSRSCRKAGCALIGGETAEMPGFYPPGEYDLAGFIVGIVERKNILNGKAVKPGDVLLGLHPRACTPTVILWRANWSSTSPSSSLKPTSPKWAIKSERNFSSRTSATRPR